MQVEYSIERTEPNLDETIELAQQAEPDAPDIRVRVQPQVYVRTGKSGSYLAWKGVYWNLKVTLQEAADLREALASFFRAILSHGPTAVQNHLDSLS